MKTQLSIPIVVSISVFMLPLLVFGQENAATPAVANPFQALPANPSLVEQIEATSLKFDEAFNNHDGDAVVALFTANATQITPVGAFTGREAIGNYYGDLFQHLNPHGRVTKINHVYAFGGDLCALGGWIVTIHGSQQAGGYLVNVYTPVGSTWKIRTSVFKYATGP